MTLPVVKPQVSKDAEDMDPTQGAALVGKGALAAVDSSVGKALLLPTATAFGDYFGEAAQEWIRARKARRTENLAQHVRRVESFTGNDSAEHVRDTQGFVDWVEGAADVDPRDEELAAVWQSALLALDRNQPNRRRLISIAKLMSPDDAAAFCAVGKLDGRFATHRVSSRPLRRLRDLGLVQNLADLINGPLGATLASSALMVLFAWMMGRGIIAQKATFGSDTQLLLVALGNDLPTLLVVSAMFAGVLVNLAVYSKPRLTTDGLHLRNLMRELASAPPSYPPETREKNENIAGGH